MGKTFNKNERKNNKYTMREINRARKIQNMLEPEEPQKRPVQKKKWRPRSEIEV